MPYGHKSDVLFRFTVECRWVPVVDGENAERCGRLRVLLLRGARRLSGVSETQTQGKEAEHAID